MSVLTDQRFAVVLALLLAAAFTPLVRFLARKIGAVARPKTDRWHKKPTAMMGGVAIYAAVVTTWLTALPLTREIKVILGAGTLLFLVGLIDDFLQIRPYQKLAGQIMGSAIVCYFGLVLPWTSSQLLNSIITIFWLIGITNAINLLDNMDGLAAGIAMISAIFLALNFQLKGDTLEVALLATFAAALLGFLFYNSNPASIFMGDCGSMFIGFTLASTSLAAGVGTAGRTRSLLPVLAVPVLILFIPIFDTTLVTIVRKISGRAASQGGRDHTSHRLVALGLSERRAVLMLYALAATAGVLALTVRNMHVDVGIAVVGSFVVALTILGVYLSRIRVYSEDEMQRAQEKPVIAFLIDLSYKRRVFEVLLDMLLVTLAYYAAYAIVFGPMNQGGDWKLFLETLPIVICIKIGAFLATGMYRGLWRYISLDNVFVFVRSSIVASIASIVAVLVAYRFEGFSRLAFFLDGVLLLSFVTASRLTFRTLATALRPGRNHDGTRVLIYGAGDGGEILLRELRNNRELRYVVAGFLDDDKTKGGKNIHGLPVFGPAVPLEEICRSREIGEIIISTSRISVERIDEVADFCDEHEIRLRRMTIQLEPVRATHLHWPHAASTESTEASDASSNVDQEILTTGPRLGVRTHGSTKIFDHFITSSSERRD